MNYLHKILASFFLLTAIGPRVLAGSYWAYEPMATFDEMGRCYSGALDEKRQVMAVGCESGIFFGPPQKLVRLGIRCLPGSGVVYRVRSLGEGAFVASTPCGLYSFSVDSPPKRIPLRADAAAMTVVDSKNVVVMLGDDLFMVDLQHGLASRIGRWPSSSRPMSLAWSNAGPISQGYTCQLGRAPWRRFFPPVHGARAALWDKENVLWIGPWGRLWKQSMLSSAVPWGSLDFLTAERVRGSKDLGRQRVWINTDYRWFLLSRDGNMEGWLPREQGPFVPMRSLSGSGPPLVVGRGVVFQAVQNANAPANWCRLSFSQHSTSTGLDEIGKLDPGFWHVFLPQITLSVGVGQDHWQKIVASAFSDLDGQDFFVSVRLQWPLGSRMEDLESERESLRRSLARRHFEEQKLVEQLMARLQLVCNYRATREARLELEQVLMQLRMLGINASEEQSARK